MSGRVELDFHVLRRLDTPNVDSTRRSPIAWLEAELQAFVERYSADRLYDTLIAPRDAWRRPRDVVECIRRLIDAGWIEVVEGSLARGSWGQTPDVLQDAVELRDLIAVGPPDPVDPEPTHKASADPDPATAAQITTLIQAANVGAPFCEICANAPPPKPATTGPDPVAAAQVATLLAAADSGAAFCEVCA